MRLRALKEGRTIVRIGGVLLTSTSDLSVAHVTDAPTVAALGAAGDVLPAAAQPSQTSQPVQRTGPMSSWHFQATYGLSSADFEIPIWDTASDPAGEEQISTTGLLTQSRYSHAIEHAVNDRQMFRWGFSLLSNQTMTGSGWLASLARDSKVPSWRSWGIGSDIFLVRRFSPACDFDAGVQLDYLLSGSNTMRSSEQNSSVNAPPLRLEQTSGWRVAFSGGISGLYLDPVGLIFRVGGYVTQATFKGHALPIRAQGIQVQIGADLALGRGGT